MDLQQRFSDQDLEEIVEEAAIYMCACPGQVANEIRQLRQLIRYQRDCINEGRASDQVHRTIAAAATSAHATMEDCLEQVLTLEGWDRNTWKMPAGLRRLRQELLDDDA